MDEPRLQAVAHLRVSPIVLYGQCYIYQVTVDHTIALFHLHHAKPRGSLLGRGTRWSAEVKQGASSTDDGEDAEASAVSANSGSFIKECLLALDVDPAANNPASWKIQVVDNLIVVHVGSLKKTCCFDVRLGSGLSSEAFEPGIDSPKGLAQSPLNRTHADPATTSPSEARLSWLERLKNWNTDKGPSATPVIRSTAPTPLVQVQMTLGHEQAVLVDDPYGAEFYNGSIPLMLHRQLGVIHGVTLDARVIASTIQDLPLRVQFLIFRAQHAGSAIPDLVRDLLLRQESITAVAQIFDLIAGFNSLRSKTKKMKEAHPGELTTTFAWKEGSPLVVGNRQRLFSAFGVNRKTPLASSRSFISSSTDGSFRAGSEGVVDESHHRGSTTCRVSSMGSSSFATCGDDFRLGDQMMMYRQVFAPLMDSSTVPLLPEGLVSPSLQGEPLLPSQRATDDSGNHFAAYLLNAIIEYARSLVENGEKLSDAVQRCLIHMLLRTPSPDLFRLHQLLIFRCIEDHIPTALQLISLSNVYPPALQMGLDMLSRLEASNEIVQVLIAKRMPLTATKFVCSVAMKDAPVADILMCSMVLHDDQRQEGGLLPFQESLPKTSSELPENVPLTDRGAEFATIFQMLVHHQRYIDQPRPEQFEPFRARYERLIRGEIA
jgi:hypothetical protein